MQFETQQWYLCKHCLIYFSVNMSSPISDVYTRQNNRCLAHVPSHAKYEQMADKRGEVREALGLSV